MVNSGGYKILEIKIFVCSMFLWNVHRRPCGGIRIRTGERRYSAE